AQPAIVRLIDNGGILLRSHLLDLALALVDPDLDDVSPVRGVLLNRLTGFSLAVDLERRAARFVSGDALSRAEEARGTRDEFVAQAEKFKAVQAKAQRGADAEISALFQVPYEPVAGRAEMGVRVDDHRHHGLTGEIHTPGAVGHANVGLTADLRDSCALHDQCRVLDHPSVAYDQPRAFERGDGLRGRRTSESGKETKGNDCCDCDHMIHSVHGNLLRTKYALLTTTCAAFGGDKRGSAYLVRRLQFLNRKCAQCPPVASICQGCLER